MAGWIKGVGMVHWAWFILGTSFITAIVSYGIRLGYGIILPEMVKSLQINKTEGGIIYSTFFMMYTLFSPVVGNLTDRFGGRQVITLSCVIVAISVLLMGTVKNLTQAILFFGIAGIGISSSWTPVVTLAARWFSPSQRGLVFGVVTLGSFLGYGALGLIFPAIISRYDWRAGWSMLGVAAFVITILNALILRNKPEDLNLLPWGEKEKRFEPSLHSSPDYRGILKKRIFWQIGLSYFLISFCYYTFISFLVIYGTSEMGIDYRTSTAFASVVAFSALTGSLPIAILSDYLGRAKTIYICELVITLSIALLIVARSNLWMVFPALFIFGLFFGPIFPLYGACSRDYFEEEVAGTVLGIWTFIYGVGATIAPFFAGLLADLTGTLRWAFILAGIASLTACLMVIVLREQKLND